MFETMSPIAQGIVLLLAAAGYLGGLVWILCSLTGGGRPRSRAGYALSTRWTRQPG